VFRVSGYTGLALAILLTQGLVLATGLSSWVMVAITLAACATFFALAMLTKIIVGHEELIYYHHEVAVLVVTTLLLSIMGQPVLSYLDITILGVGAFLVCGRVGCLMAGCCHGRPHRWGVRYGQEHVAIGFNPHLAGVRLFPTQLVESAWVAGVVLVGSALILTRQPVGSALAWYVVAYDLERFSLEFLRGDSGRPYLGGFSEAQWWSLGLLLAVVGAEWAGRLPWHWWHTGVTAGLVVTMLLVALRRRSDDRYRLLAPQHIAEVAAALSRFARPDIDGDPITVVTTSQGLQLSAGQIIPAETAATHYTFSRQGTDLSDADARALAALISNLRHHGLPCKLVRGGHSTFHLIVEEGASL
jgi:hypothetical protein